ncbi:ABC transporter ATP-binding protein [Microbacterium sp. No. 7]|uniref:ABC transporter ATP-binding protein n=1 Tax=Microbacterium sp. No. 7 TaxID=1714373 RepID=UPI0006CF368A|nr:ABC transporter ATP-binding protein [Microbacterium sp. No. 7]ALJ18543.1 dipeptide/oligopeptide/nickel ABC transporter ATP-binding protein [Microbacterium sp. No. 7]
MSRDAEATTPGDQRAPGPEALVSVDALDVHYGSGRDRVHVLRDATLHVGAGESVGLIGETGSGKSTLARAIVGLVRPSAGRVRIAGEDVTRLTQRQWQGFRRRGVVQYVFQDPLRSLDPDLTIEESLSEPLQVQRRLSRQQIRDRIAFRLEQVRLDTALLERFPGELSGGQRQRVLVARALATEPRVLILDEPVSALDAANRVAVLEILNALRAGGTSLVFISHDLGSVAGVTDRVVVMYRGELVETAATGDLVSRPQHPYTRLLVGSAPTLSAGAIDRERREELRQLLETS